MHDRVPLRLVHLDQRGIAQDTGIVHEDVHPPEIIQRRGEQASAALYGAHIGNVGHGKTAAGYDLGDRIFGGFA